MITKEKVVEDSFDISGKKVLVVGLGKSGIAVSKFLKARGASVVATDIKDISDIRGIEELSGVGITIETGGHSQKSFLSNDLIVVSPGVPLGRLEFDKARENGVEVISEVELASRYITAPIVAITGTNGKSTTTALLGEMLKRSGLRTFVGGNIGTPAIECVMAKEAPEFCVLEVSSFHLEAVSTFRPHVAVLLNVTEDHLDRYSGFADYASTKFRVFANQHPDDVAIVNAADPVITEDMGRLSAREVPFSSENELEQGIFFNGTDIVFRSEAAEELYPTGGLKISGIHNIENAMAAIGAARALGAGREAIIEALKSFHGLSHRMEFVRELEGVRYVNDSKATNVGATIKALKGIEGRVVLIAGGRDKGGDYGEMREVLKDKVKLLVVMGEAAERIKASLGSDVELQEAEDLSSALRLASRGATPGDTVLLSPACSSFDMFASYEERGKEFKRLVEAM